MFPKSNVRVAVDAVVFGYRSRTLYVLLVRNQAGTQLLPGGFVRDGEGLRAAVDRELQEEAGLRVNYLEQLRSYGDDVSRDPRAQVISVAYYGLVPPAAVQAEAGSDATDASWVPVAEVPKLGFDHNAILADAVLRLRAKLSYQPVGFELLPEVFGFSELEQLYETILQRAIDRRNFRRKVLGFGILIETGDTRSEGAGRPATLYRFDKVRYEELQREGFLFDIK